LATASVEKVEQRDILILTPLPAEQFRNRSADAPSSMSVTAAYSDLKEKNNRIIRCGFSNY
jgi:hypothetical protein